MYEKDNPVWHLLFCFLILGITVWIQKRKKMERIRTEAEPDGELSVSASGWKEWIRKNRILLAAGIFYLCWLLLVPSWGGGDSHLCMTAAKGLLQGDFRAWEPVPFDGTAGALGYAYTYPSQTGLILYMAVLIFFFGEAAQVVFQILNIGFFFLGIVSLKRMMLRDDENKGLLFWMAFCLPFSFYILFVYGTVPGFGLSCLAMERIRFFVENRRWKDFWTGALAGAAAVYLKSNYEIVLVALFLYLASSGVFRKNIRLIGAAVLLIAVFLVGNKGMQAGASGLTERPAPDGAPMIAWVEMGLQESKRGPGWYNGYQIQLFQTADGDSELAGAWARIDLKKTLSDMAEHPAKTADFFVRKMESLWAEPTFQSLWIQEVGNTACTEESIPWQLFKEEGMLNQLYILAENLMQTFVYAMSCVWIVFGMQKENQNPQIGGCRGRRLSVKTTGDEKQDILGMLLPGIVFIGGFLFHLFWEAKGQYSVVYFMLLLPYAYHGWLFIEKLYESSNRKCTQSL